MSDTIDPTAGPGPDELSLVAEDIDAQGLDDLTAAGFTCAGSFACAGSASCPASSASSGSSFSSAGG